MLDTDHRSLLEFDNQAVQQSWKDGCITAYRGFVVLGTSATLIWLLAITCYTLVHQPRQYRCWRNGTVSSLCDGPADRGSCGKDEICLADACGTKLGPGLDISVAGSVNGVSTAINATSALMVLFSLVPYLIAVILVACALFYLSDTAWSPLLLMVALTVFNEGILKSAFQQSRPAGSCLFGLSYGMPSGHASLSIGMLTYILLEISVDRGEWSLGFKCLGGVSALGFLAPVPYSRTYLQDHFASQVGVGAAEGFLVGLSWFCFMYYFAQPRLKNWCDRPVMKKLAIRHTYRLQRKPNPTAADPSIECV